MGVLSEALEVLGHFLPADIPGERLGEAKERYDTFLKCLRKGFYCLLGSIIRLSTGEKGPYLSTKSSDILNCFGALRKGQLR